MKILYVVLGYKPAWRIGGPALSVSSAAEELARRGHQVTVYTTNSNLDEPLDVPLDQPVDVDGVTVWYFEQKRTFERLPIPYVARSIGFLYTPAMRPALEKTIQNFDLVHTHLPFVYPTQLAGRAAIRAGKPLFYHQRGVYDPARMRFRGLKKRAYIALVEKPIMKKATTLIALTSEEVASYRALGVSTPIRVIPNGVRVSEYRNRPAAGSRWAQRPPGPIILFLGRLHPTKGADRLLEGFLSVAQEIPDATLVMAGPDEWKLSETYARRAAEGGIADRVLFPGPLFGEDKKDLLARADLFCLPSEAEGFSMAILEAMASSTAVLLSPRCHFPRVSEDRLGRVETTEPAAIASALRSLLSDRAELAEMGRRAREIVAECYSWERVVDQLVDAYHDGIERNRERQPR